MGPLTGGVKTIGVLIRGDNTSLRQALQQSKGEIQSFARTTNDSMRTASTGIRGATDGIVTGSGKASAALRGTTSAAQQMGAAATGSLSGVMGLMAQFAGPLGLGAILSQIARVGIGFHDFSQRATISLTTMLGSAGQAKEFLADILAFAKTTPFAFPELTASAQRLLAFGVGAEKIIPTLRALGDAAASSGSGVEMVSRLAGVVGQIQAKGRLQGDEILQLAEAGIPALRILANQAGVTAAVFSKQVTAGLVDSETAIDGLVQGLENGTTGLNGTTVAFGGLMDQIKGSGGWTSTMDSAKSGFRNMSAALTESLMPSLTSLVRLGTTTMGVIGGIADGFNAVPKPVRDAALAVTALVVANRLLGPSLATTARGGLSFLTTSFQASRAAAQAMGIQLSTTRTALMTASVAARGAGTALLGAFGGPVGLAVTGVVVAVTAMAGANAEAAARTQALADTLDAQTGALTENSSAWIANELTREQSFGVLNGSTMAETAKQMGISLLTLTAAYEGSAEAAAEAKAASQEWADAQGFDPFLKYDAQANAFNRKIDEQVAHLDNARQITEAKRGIDAAAEEQVAALGGAYRFATGQIAGFTEEQEKALESVAETARRAFDSAMSLTKMDLNTASSKDLADAQDKVTDATRRLRDAEEARQEVGEREGVTANDKIRAEEAVAEARKALEDATAAAAETEARADPVANYRRQVEEMLTTARDFTANIQTLADQGLNGKTLGDLIALGPEASKETIDALLADTSLVGLTNSAEEEMGRIGGVVEDQARLAQVAAENAGKLLGGDLGLAMRIAAEEGSADTVQAIADKLGEDPDKIFGIGRTFGLTFLAGMSDALTNTTPITMFGDDTFQTGPGAPKGYWTGGIYPGYTPGTDIGYIGVSGGEAIMRPEWTRAVGADFVHRMNALAMSGGVGAVRQAMGRYLGGFASGGVAGSYASQAPTVVTVPVQSTIERHAPFYAENVYLGSLADAERANMQRRADNNLTGRRT